MDLALEASTPGHGTHTYRVRPHRALRTAHSAIRQFVRTVHPLGCSLQLPLLGPIMPVTLVCVLVGWTTPETLKVNLYQPLDTLCNLINALMCCRIAQIATRRHIDGAGAA